MVFSYVSVRRTASKSPTPAGPTSTMPSLVSFTLMLPTPTACTAAALTATSSSSPSGRGTIDTRTRCSCASSSSVSVAVLLLTSAAAPWPSRYGTTTSRPGTPGPLRSITGASFVSSMRTRLTAASLTKLSSATTTLMLRSVGAAGSSALLPYISDRSTCSYSLALAAPRSSSV